MQVAGGARCTADCRYADGVAVRQFLQRSAPHAASGGLFFPMPSSGLSAASAFGGMGADKVALDIGQAARYRNHQAPGASAGVGPTVPLVTGIDLGVHDALDDTEEVEGAARVTVDARHRHHVAGGDGVEHA